MKSLIVGQCGMTFLEVLTAMGIVAILLSIGIPSFQYVTKTSRVSGEVNALFGDMQLARANAIREGANTIICISADQDTCLGGAGVAWNLGWIVCSDPLATGTCTGAANNQPVWHAQPPFTSTDTFNADQNTSQVTFNREGFAALPNPVTITLHESTGNANATRCLRIELSGTETTQTVGQGNCT